MNSFSRRNLLAGAAGAVAAPYIERAAEVLIRGAVKPVVISSANGNMSRNAANETCVQRAYRLMTEGSDVLDALIEGVNIVELDPNQNSVGYGGLPNADGVVQLDSCCMHGPRRWAGGVAALEGVRAPSLVARLVASSTDHHLLVGKGAQEFARNMGIKIEPDLITDSSRAAWIEWKRRTDSSHYLNPRERAEAGLRAALEMAAEGLIDPEHVWGTINCDGVNAKGEVCGVTTTSGLAFKIPGRVGDSPILGAGLYVDNAVGAAGSTGRGEANLYNLCSFLIVEEMRRGKHPKDAGMEALRRVASNTREKRLLDAVGRPNFGLQFYILDATGRHAGVAFTPSHYAVCDDAGPRLEVVEGLYNS
jgi:N4-(beta-N-acetylglucosaminyl)-L-asparaginase